MFKGRKELRNRTQRCVLDIPTIHWRSSKSAVLKCFGLLSLFPQAISLKFHCNHMMRREGNILILKIRKDRHWETDRGGISWVLNPKVFNVSIHLVLERGGQLII